MTTAIDLPDLRVEIDGSTAPTALARCLTGVLVRQSLSVPALCELTFVADNAKFLDDFPPAGASLKLRVDDHAVALFDGEVTATETSYGPDKLVQARLRGYDALHRLRKRQQIRTLRGESAKALAARLAETIGVSEVHGEDTVTWDRLVQWQQSDLEFLVDTARRSSRYVTLREDGLHVVSLAGFGEALALRLGDELREAQVDVNSDSACRMVTASGWNPWLASHVKGVADSAVSTRDVDAGVDADDVNGSGARLRINEPVQSEPQAIALAQMELDRRAAAEVTLDALAEGNPALRPAQRIKVSGLSADVCGGYTLVTVTHRIDRVRGFVSRLETAPPPANEKTRHTQTALGVVCDVADPLLLGRVRVQLVTFDDIETDWLEVVVPGAGRGKGLVALPDVDDRVLVLLMHGDPGQAVVLGGLYGDAGEPRHGVEDDRVKVFTLHTRGGQRVVLSDKRNELSLKTSSGHRLTLAPRRVRLANDEGSCLEMTHDKVRFHSERDMDIDAPGKTITLRAAAIEFETG